MGLMSVDLMQPLRTPTPSRAAPGRGPAPVKRRVCVPAWQGLGLEVLERARGANETPFPFGAAGGTYFYRARHAIYHLFRALGFGPNDTILAPDYHSGNEVGAMRASGARLSFYRINRRLEPDLEQLDRLTRSGARALFVIHYLGWPQPMRELVAMCRARGVLLIEDCALALLSGLEGRPLGAFGDFSVFCLYKTLPVPNGGLLLQNSGPLRDLEKLEWEGCGMASVAGMTAELLVRRIRGRWAGMGGAISAAKRGFGRALRLLPAKRVKVGDIGFNLTDVNTRISNLSRLLLRHFDYERIRARRQANFLRMRDRLQGAVTPLRDDLEPGVCPLFFPILVRDKEAAAAALWRRDIEAVQFWNYGDPEAAPLEGEDARYLREHVLEIPIHQDIGLEQIDYSARQILDLKIQ
jgi:dTDP-4-amino-4,6-dideoxygalactose transaminase